MAADVFAELAPQVGLGLRFGKIAGRTVQIGSQHPPTLQTVTGRRPAGGEAAPVHRVPQLTQGTEAVDVALGDGATAEPPDPDELDELDELDGAAAEVGAALEVLLVVAVAPPALMKRCTACGSTSTVSPSTTSQDARCGLGDILTVSRHKGCPLRGPGPRSVRSGRLASGWGAGGGV